MIQEYRKASAEKLGLDIHPFHYFHPKAEITYGELLYYRNECGGLPAWIPDEMADQREMIEDWLIEQHLDVRLTFEQDDGLWLVEICKVLSDGYMELYCTNDDKSKSTAFMKAFMEYIKT